MKRFPPRTIRQSDVTLSKMPMLPHTDPHQGHSLESSKVIHWICDQLQCDPPDANSEFQRAAGIGAIAFSSMRRCWHGTGLVYRNIEDEFARQEELGNPR